jgi:TonB family protein
MTSRPQHRSSGRRIGFWIGVAVLVHAELLLLIGLGLYMFAPRDADLGKNLAGRGSEQESIDVGMMDEDAAREILADLERQDEKRKAEEERKEVESVRAPGQVVEVPTPLQKQRPEDARFVSEHDTTVARETKRLGKFEDHARQGERDGTADKGQKPTVAGDGRLAMRTPDLGRFLRTPGVSGGAPRAGNQGSAYGAANAGRPEPGGSVPELGSNANPQPRGGETKGGSGPDLTPTEEQLARAIGGRTTQDALKDIDDGDETALNSKRWRFASFFNRIKRQVAEHWHPDEVYRQRDPTGAVYGRRNRYTELRVSIKPDGNLSNISLALPSGLEFLDDEAIEAFKQAGPFPNPPRQLVEANGTINFGFGFLFDLNGAPQMRWFRY